MCRRTLVRRPPPPRVKIKSWMVQEDGGGGSLKTTKTADILAKSVRSILPKGFI